MLYVTSSLSKKSPTKSVYVKICLSASYDTTVPVAPESFPVNTIPLVSVALGVVMRIG